jgi:hypothetical protein
VVPVPLIHRIPFTHPMAAMYHPMVYRMKMSRNFRHGNPYSYPNNRGYNFTHRSKRCRYFDAGHCRNGNNCKFEHIQPETSVVEEESIIEKESIVDEETIINNNNGVNDESVIETTSTEDYISDETSNTPKDLVDEVNESDI